MSDASHAANVRGQPDSASLSRMGPGGTLAGPAMDSRASRSPPTKGRTYVNRPSSCFRSTLETLERQPSRLEVSHSELPIPNFQFSTRLPSTESWTRAGKSRFATVQDRYLAENGASSSALVASHQARGAQGVSAEHALERLSSLAVNV